MHLRRSLSFMFHLFAYSLINPLLQAQLILLYFFFSGKSNHSISSISLLLLQSPLLYTKCINLLMSLRNSTKQASISNERLDEILQSLAELQYKQKQFIKNYISSAPILSSLIRQVLIEEGSIDKKGVLIIEGTSIVTKKVASGRIVFSQLNSLQIANMQIFLYNRAHYSVITHSSELKYIVLPEKILLILFNYFKTSIEEKQKSRTVVVQQKIREATKNNQKRQKQQMVDRLSLPAIKYLTKENKNIHSTDSLLKKLSPGKKLLGHSNSSSKIMKSISSKKLKNFDLQPLSNPERIQKQKSGIIESAADRNQRIFREQLKNIIKRKLLYERKQLGVLKAYRNNHQQNKVIYEENGGSVQPESNQIDQYFKM